MSNGNLFVILQYPCQIVSTEDGVLALRNIVHTRLVIRVLHICAQLGLHNIFKHVNRHKVLDFHGTFF